MAVDTSRALQERVNAHPGWYHTIDVAPGVTTPGWCDLRAVVDQLPWPDVRGKRCLDVGTFDGFFAFELEKRGAAEVVAVDVPDLTVQDWPADFRADGLEALLSGHTQPRGTGFALLKELRGSAVQWVGSNVYDLNPVEHGQFDVVVMGSLLLHLQNPVRALEAVRSVTRRSGFLMSSDQIELSLTLRSRRTPLFTLLGSGSTCQWFNFNAAGHERLLYAAGFDVVQRSRPFMVHSDEAARPGPKPWRRRFEDVGRRVLTGSSDAGILHQALVGRPRL
jgi:tRNA (mo5U34)-methyltransferase